MTLDLTLTERALNHIKFKFTKDGYPDASLRIRVTGGGCSGLSYKMEKEIEAPGLLDTSMVLDGLNVIVDLKSLTYLSGVRIDYSDDLLDSGFKFTNPNAKHSCGCGTSFGV